MPANTRKAEAPRPVSLSDRDVPAQCDDCARQQKIDTALALVAMFLEQTKATMYNQESGEIGLISRELKPKESSAYTAALDWLERYIDAPDRGH